MHKFNVKINSYSGQTAGPQECYINSNRLSQFHVKKPPTQTLISITRKHRVYLSRSVTCSFNFFISEIASGRP